MRVVAVVGSAVLHALCFALLRLVDAPPPPEPTPPATEEALEVALLELVESPSLQPPAAEPPELTPKLVDDPAAVSDPVAQSTEPSPAPPRRRTRSRSGSSTPAGDESAPVTDGVALSGLRGSSNGRAPVGPPPRPSYARAPAASNTGDSVPRPIGPRPPDTEEPRSLEEAGFHKRKDGTYKKGRLRDEFVAIIEPNGRVRFRDRRVVINGVSIKPNLMPAQKLAGEEQFRNKKIRILRETAELRRGLARAWSVKQMKRELARLDTKLRVVWGQSEWSEARRRKQLFLLWDECEEPLEEELAVNSVEAQLDAARRETGAAARKAILRFIDLKLPLNSAYAYTQEELRALNATRASRERFEPYR